MKNLVITSSGATTYGMANIEIKESTIAGTTKTFLVFADSERFGKHELVFQAARITDCIEWLISNGFEVREKTVSEMLNEQLNSKNGKIQIGNTMYRHLYRDNNRVYGYSHTDGLTDITRAFESAIVIGENKAKTTTFAYSYQRVKTIKFGNACTW